MIMLVFAVYQYDTIVRGVSEWCWVFDMHQDDAWSDVSMIWMIDVNQSDTLKQVMH